MERALIRIPALVKMVGPVIHVTNVWHCQVVNTEAVKENQIVANVIPDGKDTCAKNQFAHEAAT